MFNLYIQSINTPICIHYEYLQIVSYFNILPWTIRQTWILRRISHFITKLVYASNPPPSDAATSRVTNGRWVHSAHAGVTNEFIPMWFISWNNSFFIIRFLKDRMYSNTILLVWRVSFHVFTFSMPTVMFKMIELYYLLQRCSLQVYLLWCG